MIARWGLRDFFAFRAFHSNSKDPRQGEPDAGPILALPAGRGRRRILFDVNPNVISPIPAARVFAPPIVIVLSPFPIIGMHTQL